MCNSDYLEQTQQPEQHVQQQQEQVYSSPAHQEQHFRGLNDDPVASSYDSTMVSSNRYLNTVKLYVTFMIWGRTPMDHRFLVQLRAT